MAVRIEATGSKTLSFPASNVMANQAANTVMTWVYLRNLPAIECRIFTTSTATINQGKMAVSLYPTGFLRGYARRVTGDAVQNADSASGIVTAGRWLHIAEVCNWVTSNIRVYLNGVQVAVLGTSGWGANSENANIATNFIGSFDASGLIADGDFQDYRFYRREVPAAEMRAIYAAQGGDRVFAGLFHRLLFDNGVPGATVGSNTVRDYCNGALIGTPTGSAIWCPGIRKRARAA